VCVAYGMPAPFAVMKKGRNRSVPPFFFGRSSQSFLPDQAMTFSMAQTPQGQMPAHSPQPMQYWSSETYS
jgi:hypothetical protein